MGEQECFGAWKRQDWSMALRLALVLEWHWERTGTSAAVLAFRTMILFWGVVVLDVCLWLESRCGSCRHRQLHIPLYIRITYILRIHLPHLKNCSRCAKRFTSIFVLLLSLSCDSISLLTNLGGSSLGFISSIPLLAPANRADIGESVWWPSC